MGNDHGDTGGTGPLRRDDPQPAQDVRHRLELVRGVRDHSEDARRARRAAEAGDRCAKDNKPISTLITATRRATQCSVKFVRWVRQSLRDGAAKAVAVTRLRTLYAIL